MRGAVGDAMQEKRRHLRNLLSALGDVLELGDPCLVEAQIATRSACFDVSILWFQDVSGRCRCQVWLDQKNRFGSCVILFSNVIPAYPLGFHQSPLHIIYPLKSETIYFIILLGSLGMFGVCFFNWLCFAVSFRTDQTLAGGFLQ